LNLATNRIKDGSEGLEAVTPAMSNASPAVVSTARLAFRARTFD